MSPDDEIVNRGTYMRTPIVREIPYEEKYLNQTRELVLKITSDLDCSVFLFGSRARNTLRKSSDIDIGFSGLSESTFTRIRDLLLSELEESLIPYHVDLVNFDSVSCDFKAIALREITLWKQGYPEKQAILKLR